MNIFIKSGKVSEVRLADKLSGRMKIFLLQLLLIKQQEQR